MNTLKTFEKHFREGMINKDFEAFKKSHPTLLKVILAAMDDVATTRLTDYNDFLLKNGYTDTDIELESPTAIDQFLAVVRTSKGHKGHK